MKVKEVERTANLAWSPANQHPVMLVAGTAAQQLDASFSTSAQLEVCALGLAQPGLDMEVKASVPSEHRFHKVAWGPYSGRQEAGGGVIVGGCDGGRMQIYSASKLLAGEDGIVASKDKHVGPVRSLDFNPYQANLLATGASESEIFIWDLNNTDTPMLPGAKSQPADDVLSLSWNRQVQHILASAFSQRCVVWDLRKNEPIIKLSDASSRVRWKALAWHPDVATQLCLASEEDQLPVIQLWDLRFATSPVKVLQGHQRGVLSVAWCAQDPDLLVSCGKENHIIVWNPNAPDQSGEVVCDLATTNQWHFDISWCPRNPALIACSSFDGHASVYSLTGGQQQVQTSNKIADSFPGMDAFAQAPTSQPHASVVDLRKAPKWLRRPCRATFGFGGKLATFEREVGAPQHLVYLSQVVTEPQLVERSQQLEQVLQCGQLEEFCESKAAAARSVHEGQLWKFLRARLSPDPRAELLTLLGFKPEDVGSKLNRYLDKPANAKLNGSVENLTSHVAAIGQEDHRQVNGVTAANFLNSAENISSESLKILTDDGASGLISQALLLGNTEAAVELCLQEERFADAVILAMTGGSDLLARTQYRYFQKCKGALSALISAVVTEDWSHVVRNCSLDSWKEALAATLTHTKSDQFPALCGQLAERLVAEGRDSALSAQLCHVCSGDLDRLVESWTTVFQPNTPDKLQELVELAVVLRKATEPASPSCTVSGQLAQLMSRYAGLLAAQGSLGTALAYLHESDDENVNLLKDRLYCALGHKQPYQQQPYQPQPQVQVQPAQQQQTGRVGRRTSAQGWQVPADQSSYGKPYHAASGYGAADSKLFPVKTSQPIPPPQRPSACEMAQPFATGVPPYATLAPTQSFSMQAPAQQYGQAQPYSSAPRTSFSPAPTALRSSPAPAGAGMGGPARGRYVLDPTLQANSGGAAFPGVGAGASFPPQQFAPAPVNIYNPAADVPPQSVPLQQQFQAPAAANAPAGWNDPPSLGPVRSQPKVEYAQQTPITHPLYGAVPAEQVPGNIAPPNMPVGGGYGDPAYSYAPPMQQQQQQQQQQQRPATPATPRDVAPPQQKPPLPEEFMYLQTVFDELRNRCMIAAANPQTKRKLDDVARKLEMLYDALRSCKLSPHTVQGLHQMVQMVQIGDYSGCLGLHTQLVSGPDFSQIASFMPGLKVLIQSALQLGVYLQ